MTHWTRLMLLGLCLLIPGLPAAGFDHAAWDALLKRHVWLIDGGVASQVDYFGFQSDHAALKSYLATLSAVSRAEFESWSKPEQLAFLINAYNAYTVELILTRYPDLSSIKDLGRLFQSPWKQEFFTLFGEPAHLDHIEHELIRARGRYDDPRIHCAVNCASVGCPKLLAEAFVGARIEEQLEGAMRGFLSDHSRNRYDPKTQTLQVSRIFDWYGEDFEQGYRGYTSVAQTLARYAAELAEDPADQARVRSGKLPIEFLDYDWKLNDTGRR